MSGLVWDQLLTLDAGQSWPSVSGVCMGGAGGEPVSENWSAWWLAKPLSAKFKSLARRWERKLNALMTPMTAPHMFPIWGWCFFGFFFFLLFFFTPQMGRNTIPLA